MVYVHLDRGVSGVVPVVDWSHTRKRVAALLAGNERHCHSLQSAVDEGVARVLQELVGRVPSPGLSDPLPCSSGVLRLRARARLRRY
jgi:hypothetical protein